MQEKKSAHRTHCPPDNYVLTYKPPFCNVIDFNGGPRYDILDFFEMYNDLIRVKVPLYSLSTILQLSVYILTTPVIDVDGSFHSPFTFLNPAPSFLLVSPVSYQTICSCKELV